MPAFLDNVKYSKPTLIKKDSLTDISFNIGSAIALSLFLNLLLSINDFNSNMVFCEISDMFKSLILTD